MKTFRLPLLALSLSFLLSSCFSYKQLSHPGKNGHSPYLGPHKIQIALLLDTSTSMEKYLEQAKTEFWFMVDQIHSAYQDGTPPQLEIALYEYGNKKIGRRNKFIRQRVPFTMDLDWISSEMFKLKAKGRGKEYCGQVIKEAVNELTWSQNASDIKMIFIAGNESFHKGNYSPRRAIRQACRRDIEVHTIYAGDYSKGVKQGWQDAADECGSYSNLDLDRPRQQYETRYDQEICDLNVYYMDTYIPYGSYGSRYYDRCYRQDVYFQNYGTSYYSWRTVVKCSPWYYNPYWDLVDAYDCGLVDLGTMPCSDLPDFMCDWTVDQRVEYVLEKKRRRETIREEITTLNYKRRTIIEEQVSVHRGSDRVQTRFDQIVSHNVIKKVNAPEYRDQIGRDPIVRNDPGTSRDEIRVRPDVTEKRPNDVVRKPITESPDRIRSRPQINQQKQLEEIRKKHHVNERRELEERRNPTTRPQRDIVEERRPQIEDVRRNEQIQRQNEERRQNEIEQRRRDEQIRRQNEERRQADIEQRRRDEQIRRQNEERRQADIEQRRRDEQIRRQNEARKQAEVEQRRRDEQIRRQNEERRQADIEQRRRDEQIRRQNEARKQADIEQRRRDEQIRRQNEARKQAEIEQRRRNEEVRRQSEARRQAEIEQRRQAEQARRQADARRKAEIEQRHRQSQRQYQSPSRTVTKPSRSSSSSSSSSYSRPSRSSSSSNSSSYSRPSRSSSSSSSSSYSKPSRSSSSSSSSSYSRPSRSSSSSSSRSVSRPSSSPSRSVSRPSSSSSSRSVSRPSSSPSRSVSRPSSSSSSRSVSRPSSSSSSRSVSRPSSSGSSRSVSRPSSSSKKPIRR